MSPSRKPALLRPLLHLLLRLLLRPLQPSTASRARMRLIKTR
jgi:hypothetical protein